MAYDDHGFRIRREMLLKPCHRVCVEVVRRLVEYQKLRLRCEKLREKQSRSLSARQTGERLRVHALGKAEMYEYAFAFRFVVQSAAFRETRVQRRKFGCRRLKLRAGRGVELFLKHGKPCFDRTQFSECVVHPVEHGFLTAVRKKGAVRQRILLEHSDAVVFRNVYTALGRSETGRNHPEQR